MRIGGKREKQPRNGIKMRRIGGEWNYEIKLGLIYGGTETVDFESFSKILNRPGGFRDPGEPEEYCRGFQVFDKDMTGFIGVGQLRYSK